MGLILKRGLLAGFASLAIGLIFNWIVGIVLPGVAAEYQNQYLFRPWTDPLMIVYFGYPFIAGIALAYLWGRLAKTNAFDFAKLYFLVATIPGMFVTYTSFQVSLAMVLCWTVNGFIQAFVAGVVFTKLKK